MFALCVSREGEVEGVKVLRSTIPGGLDGDWIAKFETWRYQPVMKDGQPVRACIPVRMQIASSPTDGLPFAPLDR